MSKASVSFTEEAVFHPPEGLRHYRYYRLENWNENCTGYPIERGGLWLPRHVDITEVEDFINGEISGQRHHPPEVQAVLEAAESLIMYGDLYDTPDYPFDFAFVNAVKALKENNNE